MLINFGVGDTGSNQIINVNLPTQFPWALILDIQLRGNYFSLKRITDERANFNELLIARSHASIRSRFILLPSKIAAYRSSVLPITAGRWPKL